MILLLIGMLAVIYVATKNQPNTRVYGKKTGRCGCASKTVAPSANDTAQSPGANGGSFSSPGSSNYIGNESCPISQASGKCSCKN